VQFVTNFFFAPKQEAYGGYYNISVPVFTVNFNSSKEVKAPPIATIWLAMQILLKWEPWHTHKPIPQTLYIGVSFLH
jgi:hypothetical protein